MCGALHYPLIFSLFNSGYSPNLARSLESKFYVQCINYKSRSVLPTNKIIMTSMCSEKPLIKLLNGTFLKEQNSETYCWRSYPVDNDPLISNHLSFNPQPFIASCVFLHLIHKDLVTGL